MPQVKKTRARAHPPRRPARRAPATRSRPVTPGSGWSMKLGAWAHARMRQVEYDPNLRTGLTVLALTAVTLVFALVFVASGMARSLGSGLATAAAGAARGAGLSVAAVDVQARAGFALTDLQRAEVADVAAVAPDTILFALDPAGIRDRVMSLPWVEGVTVRRLWPDRVQILVEPRPAVAVWQQGGSLALFDARGRLLAPVTPQAARGFALVIGPGAPQAAPALFAALAQQPALARRIAHAERVGQRRWTLHLRSGAAVLLPEQAVGAAVTRLAALQASHRLLDRPFERLDLRVPGRLIIRRGTEVPGTIPAGGV